MGSSADVVRRRRVARRPRREPSTGGLTHRTSTAGLLRGRTRPRDPDAECMSPAPTDLADRWAALQTIAHREGAFLRREAVAHAVDDATLRRATRSGVLVRVRHGAYAFAAGWDDLDDRGRHVLRSRAAMRVLGDRVALSHHSASAVFDLDLWDVPLEQVHVTRLDGGAGRSEGDVRHHEALVLDSDLVRLHGAPVVRPVRAALESASLSGLERGLVTVDSGLRNGLFTAADLAAQHALMQSWPGAQHLHVVTRLADGRSGSVGESRSRYLFYIQRLPAPVLQFPVYDGGRLVGISDFAWPGSGLLGEFDGRVKYGRLLRPGEDAGDAVFREKRREDLLRRLTGWRMVRLVWADLHSPERTAAWLRSELRVAA